LHVRSIIRVPYVLCVWSVMCLQSGRGTIYRQLRWVCTNNTTNRIDSGQ